MMTSTFCKDMAVEQEKEVLDMSPLHPMYKIPIFTGFFNPAASALATAAGFAGSSRSSTPSLDHLSVGGGSAGSISPVSAPMHSPFLFPPFQRIPLLASSFLPGESPFSVFSYLQQHSLIAAVPFSSPSSASSGGGIPGMAAGGGGIGGLTEVKCAICLAPFPNEFLLHQHHRMQHSGHSSRRSSHHQQSERAAAGDEKPFQCDQCGQSYRYRSAYVKHREQNHRARLPADKLFTCDICGMQFRYHKSFKKHRLNHTLEMLHPTTATASSCSTGSISASSCSTNSSGGSTGATTPKKDARHTPETPPSDSEQSEPMDLNCSSLRAASNGSDSSSGNGATEGEPKAIGRVVSESKVTSSNEIELRSSLNSSTPGTPAEEGVDSIGMALAGEPTLFNLLRFPERQRERQLFACSFCNKTVRSKENLKLHVRKHTGERPFACLFCGRAFGGKSDLTRHVRIHTGERPYHCETCGKCFARADYLSKHLTTHNHNHTNRTAAILD